MKLLRVMAIAALMIATVRGQTNMLADVKIKAPEFPKGLTWLNSQPLTLAQLRGKVVLLDFWTYSCINCMHIIPDLKRLEDKYKDDLVIIGVHSAKFSNEKQVQNIRDAILRYDLRHPIIVDNDFIIWDNYAIHAWPTLVLIDPSGNIVEEVAGEGVYDTFDATIAQIIKDSEFRGLLDPRPIKLDLEKSEMPASVLSFPGKIVADEKSGRLFFTDSGHNRIIISSLDGQIEDVIGSGDIGFTDGDYASARFSYPQGLYFDSAVNVIYVADTDNHAIREIDLASNRVTTLAGNGMQAEYQARGGTGTKASLNSPWDLVELNGKLYIAMAGAHQIWTLDPKTLEVAPFAGSGSEDIADGPLNSAAFAQPSGIATDGRSLYIADSEVSAVRRIDFGPGGRVKTIIGTGLFDFGDVDGKYPKARLQHPIGIAYHDGSLYVADSFNNKIKKVDPVSREAATFVGNGKPGMDDGPAKSSSLNEPNGIAFADGKMFITDTNNNLIRVDDLAAGSVSTLMLKGLRMLTRASVFRGEEKDLPSMEVAAGPGKLDLELKLPNGTEFSQGAPFSIDLKSDNPAVVKFNKPNITKPAEKLEIPLAAATGKTIITINMEIYYCSGNQGQCFFKEARLIIPVIVTEKGGQALTATYQIMH